MIMDHKEIAKMGALGVAWVCTVVLSIAIALAPTWVAFSLVASGVKALAKSCGERYPVEVVLSADWFCPEQEGR